VNTSSAGLTNNFGGVQSQGWQSNRPCHPSLVIDSSHQTARDKRTLPEHQGRIRVPVFPVETPVIANGMPVRLVANAVSAGFPSPAGDDLEDEIDPISWVVRHPSSTFWWRVEGDCLWDAGIRDGDIIAVDRAGKRRVGRAVLAVVEGAVTAKMLRKRDGRYFLAPANSKESFPDIELTEDSEIWGVIAGVVRRYDLE
jgi:DNA polymerase V